MKQVSQALRDSLYNNDLHVLADLYTLAFRDGTKRFTSHPTAITVGVTTWATGPGFERSDLRCTSGLEVDTLQVTIYPDATTVGGVAMVQAARTGLFDAIRFTLQRVYMPTAGDVSAGVVTEFDGTVDKVEASSTEIRLTVKSLLAQLGVQLPRRLTMAQCPYTVYSAACGASKAAFTHTRTAAAGSTASVVNLSSSSTNASVGGTIAFTSGALAGVTRTVKAVSGSAVTVNALPAAPTVGDGITVVRGCDRTRTTCGTVFSRLVSFGGFPDTPASETT
jgi:uncharacterized phage protein (TIGR02218 family)